jgi:multiple antibiotic resistance protein
MKSFVLATFVTFFVTLNPIESAAFFSALTHGATHAYRRRMAIKAAMVATGLMLGFALFGDDLLRVMGITLPSVRISGGILLMLVSIDVVFGRGVAASGAVSATGERADISVFPLATPVIAGPGAIAAAIVRSSEVENGLLGTGVVIALILFVMALTLAAMLSSTAIHRVLGETGMSVVTRILGILLTALAIEMILTGIKNSGVFALHR